MEKSNPCVISDDGSNSILTLDRSHVRFQKSAKKSAFTARVGRGNERGGFHIWCLLRGSEKFPNLPRSHIYLAEMRMPRSQKVADVVNESPRWEGAIYHGHFPKVISNSKRQTYSIATGGSELRFSQLADRRVAQPHAVSTHTHANEEAGEIFPPRLTLTNRSRSLSARS